MYRVRSTGEILSQGEVRKLHPNSSLPRVWDEAVCNELGIDPVLEGAQATPTDPYHFSIQQGVEEINGKWFTKYVLGPTFTEYTDAEGVTHTAAEQEAAYRAQKDEEQAKSVRADRDRRLAESDWTQVADVPFSEAKKAEWAAYRQALRDVPTQAGFPWNVEWPVKPE